VDAGKEGEQERMATGEGVVEAVVERIRGFKVEDGVVKVAGGCRRSARFLHDPVS
jgi:F420-0:gamma-glutamyl ligase-like protein